LISLKTHKVFSIKTKSFAIIIYQLKRGREKMSFVDVFTVFSAIFGAWAFYFQSRLQDKESTVSLIDTLIKHNYFQFYKSYLKNSLDHIDNYLGKPSWSLNSLATNLSFHYLVAIFYVLFVFFLLWFLGGENSIGTLEILPKKESYGERLLVILGLIFIGFLFYFLVSKKFDAIEKKFNNKFTSLLPNSLQKHSHLIQKSLVGLLSFFLLLSFTTLSHTLIFTLLFISLDISLLYFLVVGVVGVGGVGLIGLASLLDGGNFFTSYSISLLIFLLLIPLLNAFLDFISLTLSRYFSRKILKENLFLIIFHLILDFIFAIFSLILLLAVLYYSIELFNAMIDPEL
jgi:hypothetical protein